MLTAGITADTSRFSRMVGTLGNVAAAPMRSPEMREGVESAIHAYAESMQKRFNRASGGDGTWPKLARSTIAKKRKKTLFPDRILYVIGTLFASLTPGNGGSIYETQADRVRYGTRVPFAHYHQEGGRHLPQRRILTAPAREVLDRCTAEITAAWQKTITRVCTNN